MELCDQHWDELRDAIRLHGLWDLQVHDAAQAAEIERAINGTPQEGDNEEPLFDSVIAVQVLSFQKAIDTAGIELVFEDAAGEDLRCPFCEGAKRGHDYKPWINEACDEVRVEAINLELITEIVQ